MSPVAVAHHLAAQSAGVSIPMLMIGLVLIVVVLGIAYEQHRKKKFQAFAASRGLTYASRDDSWVRLDTGRPYGEGRAHKAKHVMTGQHRGRPVVVYEHQWTTGSGKDSQTHSVRKTLMGLPRSFPRLDVRKEGFFGRTARRMGMKDIELESDDFNREFRVMGDRRLAYDVLHPRLMEWMLHTDSPGFVINGPYIAYTTGSRIDLNQVDGEIAYLDTIIDRLPRYVVEG